jgi:hypothetical protein
MINSILKKRELPPINGKGNNAVEEATSPVSMFEGWNE